MQNQSNKPKKIETNLSTVEDFLKAGLINEEKFSRCKMFPSKGKYTDYNGDPITRVTILVDENALTGADMLNRIKSTTVDAVNASHTESTDDLAAEMAA